MRLLGRVQQWFCFALLGGSIAMGGGSSFSGGRPVENVRIALDPWNSQKEPFTIESADLDRMEALVTVLIAAVPSKDHKCRSVGTIELRFKDGDTSLMGLLPGHDPDYYQLRLFSDDNHYKVLQVPRGSFFAALERLGVPVSDPEFPQ